MSRRLRLLQTNLLATLLVGCFTHSNLLGTAPSNWTYLDASGVSYNFDTSEDMCDNVVDGGAIGSDVTGCPNPTFQAPTLTNESLPQGGSGDIEFAWMTTFEDPASGTPVSWTIIPNTNSADYTPRPLARTAYFMRCARRAGCTKYAGESNYVTITIDCCEQPANGGAIEGDQTSCGLPYDPTLIRNSMGVTPPANGIVYGWYTSTTNPVYTPESADWTEVPGITTPWYDPSSVNEVTYYVRTARGTFCDEIEQFSNVITVEAFANPTVKADVTNITCAGGNDGEIAVTIQNAANPIQRLEWEDGSTDLTRTNLAAGDYTFTIQDANGCETIEVITLSEPAAITATIAANFDACNFQDDAAVFVNASGGVPPYAYAWDGGETTQTLINQSAGNFRVVVTDANGCTVEASFELAPPARFAATLSKTDPVCYQANGSITVAPTGGVAPYRYVWTPNVSTTETASNVPGGSYAVAVFDANDCQVDLVVDLDDTAPIQIALEADVISCNGDETADIRSTVTGGLAPYAYSWTDESATVVGTDPILAAVGRGEYTLTITDDNGCTEMAVILLAEPDALMVSLDVTQPICREDGGTLAANITGGTAPYSLIWTRGGTVVANDVQTLNNQPAGDYSVDITDAAGCTVTADATIEDIALLVLTTSKVDATCPGSDDGSAQVIATGGEAPYSYLWSDPSAQTTAIATNLTAGTYRVAVQDARGCLKSADVLVENSSTGPQIAADTTALECFGAATADIDLTISEGLPPYTFAWEDNGVLTGITTEDRMGLSAGTYRVVVTDFAGCEAEQTFTFEDPEELMVTARPTSFYPEYFHISAYDAADGAVIADVTGGTGNYTYEWMQDGAVVGTAATLSGLGGGVVSVTVRDGNCVATHDTLLIEPSMISDFVWEDENGDGIQDAGEPGLEGVIVTLTGTDFNGLQVNFTATSDAYGLYQFDQLPPSQGDYTLSFDLPRFRDYLFSPVNQGADDSIDSDMDPVSLLIAREVTDFGIGDFDTDAGFIPRTSAITISDLVFYDADHDGFQDPFEVAVQGVTMSLFRSSDDLFIDAVVSNEDGEYFLTDVVPGTYYVVADQSSSPIAATYEVSPKDNVPGNDVADSDFDPVTLRSDDIVVTADTEDIVDVDLGLHSPCGEVDTPGSIEADETVCRGEVPMPIASMSEPTGAARYQWLRSRSNNYRGPNDPSWETIPGATAAGYAPSGITTTWHYIRLAAVAGCADFTGATDPVTKTVNPLPNAEITSAPRNVCISDGNTYTFTADSTAPVTFEWDFREFADVRYATGRVVDGVDFNTHSQQFFVLLTITDANGCTASDSVRVFSRNCFGPGETEGLNARSTNGTNTLTWRSVSYVEGSYYNIERALEQEDFEVIDAIDAEELDRWITYTYVDAFAPTGAVRYRISHEAPSTQPAASAVVELDVEQLGMATKVYPNPVRNRLMVELATAAGGNTEFALQNTYGKTVQQGVLESGAKELDLSGLANGTYFLRFISADGTTEVRSIVKH